MSIVNKIFESPIPGVGIRASVKQASGFFPAQGLTKNGKFWGNNPDVTQPSYATTASVQQNYPISLAGGAIGVPTAQRNLS